MHTLENYLDIYSNHAVMVVTEAIANSLDAGARKVQIVLKDDVDDEKTISFCDDGPGMTKRQFRRYHVLSGSDKTKGSGIGFAGIGAKVYLAAWPDTYILTETTDGKKSFGSRMYVRGKVPVVEYLDKPSIRNPGTCYTVRLKPVDYDYLVGSLEYDVVEAFNPAIMRGVKIWINGKSVAAWDPECEFERSFDANVKGRKFPVTLRVTKDEIDGARFSGKHALFQYHVSGKIITTKQPDWAHEIRAPYKKRVHAYIDALALSDQLNLDKRHFKSGFVSGPVYKEVDRRAYDLLKRHNYIDVEQTGARTRSPLTKFFEKLFRKPEYAFLNPHSRVGPGQSSDAGGGDDGGSGGRNATGTGPREGDGGGSSGGGKGTGSRGGGTQSGGGGSLHVEPRAAKNNPREGWLDPSTNIVVINTEHPLYIKYENNPQARNQRVAHIMTNILIKNAVTKMSMDATKALDLQTEILTLAKDVTW